MKFKLRGLCNVWRYSRSAQLLNVYRVLPLLHWILLLATFEKVLTAISMFTVNSLDRRAESWQQFTIREGKTTKYHWQPSSRLSIFYSGTNITEGGAPSVFRHRSMVKNFTIYAEIINYFRKLVYNNFINNLTPRWQTCYTVKLFQLL